METQPKYKAFGYVTSLHPCRFQKSSANPPTKAVNTSTSHCTLIMLNQAESC